uniref:Rab3 GTPase-activating protein catalytic subunit n=1 Tax=Plectus sambesii TaxID=2011161 RepID=A0A914VJ43_9BILA
ALRNGQPRHTNLAGLLDLFKEKIVCPLPTPPPVKVSVRVDYTLQERLDRQWTQPLPDFDDDVDLNGLLVGPYSHLPFGAAQDPLREFCLSATWPNLNEDMIVENDVYSDLDPMTAPYWTAAVAFESGLQCLMHGCLTSLVNATRYQSTIDAILGIEENAVGSAALERLTQPQAARILQPNLSLTNPTGGGESYSLPFDSSTVNRLIDAIFNDVGGFSDLTETTNAKQIAEGGKADRARHESPGIAVKEVTSDRPPSPPLTPSDDMVNKYMELLKQCKSAPADCLTSRLAVALCHILWSSHGLPGMCQIWHEVVICLRSYWEKFDLLPGFDTDAPPDMGSCLLHQKLMMLQCCIESKQKRHRSFEATTNFSDTMDEDDFFDAIEDVDNVDLAEPQGRLKPLMDLKLLNKPTVPLYIPVTQDPSPMTEDLLEEHAEYLTSLGDSFDAGKARAKAQSDSLLADMQAFKAANPGCCMEDFVRWHSPRDWIIDQADPLTGRLSERMSSAGNAWIESWQSARPVPVSLQKRLFNESKEAEKILHWLGGLTVCELTTLLLPPLFASAVRQISREAIDVHTLIGEKLDVLCHKLLFCTRQGSLDDFRDLLSNVHWVESTTAQYRALRARLTLSPDAADAASKQPRVTEADMKHFVLALMQNTNGAVPIFGAANGPIGLAVRRLLDSDARLAGVVETAEGAKKTSSKNRVPPAARKQYVLRWVVPRPMDYSRLTPQRMYVNIDERTEFRLCGAFSEDVTLS